MSKMEGHIRSGDRKRKHGRPEGTRTAPPLLTLRNAGCSDRLARIYVTGDGFLLLTDRFRVTAEQQFRRSQWTDEDGNPRVVDGVELSFESWQEGRLAADRFVRGLERLFPLEMDQWEDGARFELGCDHAHGWMRVDDLSERVRAAAEASRQRKKPPRSAVDVNLPAL